MHGQRQASIGMETDASKSPKKVSDGFQAMDDRDNDDDRVPLDCLKKLADSSDLKALLQNKHLQQLLSEVDSADNKAAIVEKFMHEPLFVEFADQCLAVVTPEEDVKSGR